MTLREYINQTEPARMPRVILNRAQYKLGVKYTRPYWGSEQTIFITSPLFHKAFPELRNEYKLCGEHSKTLYTTDTDGNAKGRSCFQIES